MNQYPKTFPIAGAKRQRLAVVCALWHADLVAQARDALLDELAQLGITEDRVDRYDVPGAFEIPLLAQQLARSGAMRRSSPARWWSTAASTAMSSSPARRSTV